MQGDANLTPDQRELLEELERSGQHMMEIINHTLTLHKIERGEYEAALRRIDCLSIIRSVRSYYRQQQASAGIRILAGGRHPEDETVCFVDAEENLLRTALMNIVKNALEASPKGREIIIDVLQNAHTTIRVENAGAVPMQVRDNFFEKYSTSGKRGGTGLGTYSAKIMINAQNANIAMHTEGKGDAGKTVVDIIF